MLLNFEEGLLPGSTLKGLEERLNSRLDTSPKFFILAQQAGTPGTKSGAVKNNRLQVSMLLSTSLRPVTKVHWQRVGMT
jgi:hypothetical protein